MKDILIWRAGTSSLAGGELLSADLPSRAGGAGPRKRQGKAGQHETAKGNRDEGTKGTKGAKTKKISPFNPLIPLVRNV